jgi:hypothetical protein
MTILGIGYATLAHKPNCATLPLMGLCEQEPAVVGYCPAFAAE